MRTRSVLANLSERQLLTRFGDLVRRDRRRTAQMLAVIAEIDQRKLWAKHACPSMFAFCVRRFHMSESATAKRIWAARTARRFPLILTMVARGELHLTAIVQLATHLTEDNHRAVLLRAKHKSAREVEQLVAELAPRPDVPSRIRALPSPAGRAEGAGPSSAGVCTCTCPRHGECSEQTSGCPVGKGAGRTVGRPAEENSEAAPAQAGEPPAPPAPTRSRDALRAPNAPCEPCAPRSRRQIVALAPRRYKIEITVDQQTHDNLRMLQDLLSHRLPGADPAIIVSRAIDRLLADTLKKKVAISDQSRGRDARRNGSQDGSSDRSADRPGDRSSDGRCDRAGCHDRRRGRPGDRQCSGRGDQRGDQRGNQGGDRRTRAIPAAIRREVWQRDGGRCTFVDARGRRCGGTRGVEYHHEVPYGKGGRHEAGNLTLRCRAHNQYQADLDFGRGFMRDKRRGDAPHSARNVRLGVVAGAIASRRD